MVDYREKDDNGKYVHDVPVNDVLEVIVNGEKYFMRPGDSMTYGGKGMATLDRRIPVQKSLVNVSFESVGNMVDVLC